MEMLHSIKLYRNKPNKEVILDVSQLIAKGWAKWSDDYAELVITNKNIEYVGAFDVGNYI